MCHHASTQMCTYPLTYWNTNFVAINVYIAQLITKGYIPQYILRGVTQTSTFENLA